MRRVIPLFFLILGTAALLHSQTAEARHGRRYRRRCQYYRACTVATQNYECLQYKMMQMGGIYHYYSLEYPLPAGCNGTPTAVSYDSTDGTLNTSCACFGACCLTITRFRDGAQCATGSPVLRTHVPVGPHGVPPHYHGEAGVHAEDPMIDPMNKHGKLEAGTTQDLYGEFVVKVDVHPPWWVKVGRFTYSDPANARQMPLLVGYEVDHPTGPADVTVPGTAVTPVSGFDYLNTLTIPAGVAGPHGERRDGDYQVIRAR
jgi:hypothetical protein